MHLPQIMGILNVTPDSFSDGGQFHSFESALSQAEKLIVDGADILDIGGESTRPFSKPVSLEDELKRTIPVIEAIRKKHSIQISIDTSKAEVAKQALEAGANIVNDVTGLTKDPEMVKVVKNNDIPVVIMHMQKSPANMQIQPTYNNVVEEIISFFRSRLIDLEKEGIDKKKITIDPGIGFGKTLEHNLSLLKYLYRFNELGCQVLLGHSRKRFIGDITGRDTELRDTATAVVSALAFKHNISILRVHNVTATKDAINIAKAIHLAKEC